MSENELFMGFYALAVLGLVVLVIAGDLILKRAKAARDKRILKAAAERARERILLARYNRILSDPVDMDALEAELAKEFGPLSVEQGARFQ
jgi:hypothetical protein